MILIRFIVILVINTNAGSSFNTSSTGGAETRMKNTAGQWYLLLKIDI